MKWHNEKRRVNDLIPIPNNPRQLTEKQFKDLETSLKKFNLVEIPAINTDNKILAGHQRLKILQSLGCGEEEIDVRVPDRLLSEKECKEYLIRSNKNTGEWDFDILANNFEIDDLKDWGFEDKDLKIYFSTPMEDDDVPEVPKEPVCKEGDLWQLGSHRLLCGDSTNPQHVERLLGGAKPFIMVTDPPYGVEYDPNWRNVAAEEGHLSYGARAIGKVENDSIADWSAAWLLSPCDVIYTWSPGGDHVLITGKALVDSGFEIRSMIIWKKAHFAISRGAYHYQHEPCWYAVRKGKKALWCGDRSQSTIWEINHIKNETGHGTQKPVECMARPIRNHGGKDDDVYDPFLGSGTTLIAAEKLGRRCFGLEISPNYCDVIIKRWENISGKKAKLCEAGQVNQ